MSSPKKAKGKKLSATIQIPNGPVQEEISEPGIYPEATTPRSEFEHQDLLQMAQFTQQVNGNLQQDQNLNGGQAPQNLNIPASFLPVQPTQFYSFTPPFGLEPRTSLQTNPVGLFSVAQQQQNLFNQSTAQSNANSMYNCYANLIANAILPAATAAAVNLAGNKPCNRRPPLNLNSNDLYLGLPANTSRCSMKIFLKDPFGNFGGTCSQDQKDGVASPCGATPCGVSRCRRTICRRKRPKLKQNYCISINLPDIKVCPCPCPRESPPPPSPPEEEDPPSPPEEEEPDDSDGPPSPLRLFFGKPDKHGRQQTQMLSKTIMGNPKDLDSLSIGSRTPNASTFMGQQNEPRSRGSTSSTKADDDYHHGLSFSVE